MMKISTDSPAFRVRPAQPEEAGAFFAQTPEQNAQMGAIGCVRMDFGRSGTAFWHTWHPRGREELNSPEFKAELQQVVDTLRETVLKDLSSMRHFCYENGGKIPGGWSQNYGYVVETENYEYCLRCNPVPGDYQAHLLCYDLNEQKINHAYMSDKLLTEGNTVAALDELYIWLSNPVAVEYIRNALKRVRKKESALLMASQNLEDFDQPGVREMTKPLFSIPPHQFLFNAGSIDRRAYMDMLQLEDSEFDLIKFPQRGVCLYKCGNERYLLEVHAPPYKEALFGKAGGR